MAATYGNNGSASEGTTEVTPAYPGSITAGMMLLLVVANKYPSNGPATPDGWTLLGQAEGGAGAAGPASGPVYVTVFWKIANGTETSAMTVTVSIPDGVSARATIHRIAKTGPEAFLAPTFTTGADNNAADTTNFSATGAAGLDLVVDDLVLVCAGGNANIAYSGHTIAATGATFGTVTERSDSGTNLGDDCRLFGASASVTAGASDVAPEYTATAASGAPTGAAVFIRLRTTPRIGTIGNGSQVAAADAELTVTNTVNPILAGDLMLACCVTKYPGANIGIPQGWKILAQAEGGAGDPGVGTGNVRLTLMYKIADGSETGTSVTFPTSGSNVTRIRISVFRPVNPSTKVWQLVTSVGNDNSSGTDWAVSSADNLNLEAGDMLLVVSAINAAGTLVTFTAAGSAPDATLEGFITAGDLTGSAGDGVGGGLRFSAVTAGPSSDVASFTATLETAGAGVALFVRMREIDPTDYDVIDQLVGDRHQSSMIQPMISRMI